MTKRKIMWIICLVAYTIVFGTNILCTTVNAASDLEFEWNKNDTMDNLLRIISNKAGDDEALISWKLENYGSYKLEYYLKDTIKTEVTFEHQVDKVIVKYRMIKIDTSKSVGDAGRETNITEDEFDKSFAMMNYKLLVPQLETITDKSGLINSEKTLEYTIQRGASSKYPGASFLINTLDVRFRWDMQTKTMNYFIKDIKKGNILPFKLTIPDGTTDKIELLRAFDNFEITPTHWIKGSSGNEDIKTVESPKSNIRPGSKPGLRITFNRPKVFNDATDKLKYETATNNQLKKADDNLIEAVLELRDISGKGDNTDIAIKLDSTNGKFTTKPESTDSNNNAEYKYNYNNANDTGTYTIELVKDRSGLDRADTDFLQWDKLGASRVYTAAISLQESPTYKFCRYEPENKYAYTYLEYIVKRASMGDAYLDIVPYAGSNADDLEYTIYHSKTYNSNYGKGDIWLKHYHKQEYSDMNIYIPVPFENGSAKEFYQVGVQFAGESLRSQTIKYIPDDDKDVPPPVPRVKEIKNLAVVPPKEDSSNIPTKVQFDLTWHAPDKDLLKNMLSKSNSAIYYEILFNDIPLEDSSNQYTITKVFKVFMDSTKQIKVQEVDTGMPLATTLDKGNFVSGYNSRDNLFELKNIVLKDTNGWSKPVIKDTSNKGEPYKKALDSSDEYDYIFPGINFMRMRSVYVIKEADGGVGESDRSIADSISLSMLRYDIPIAENINYTPRITTEENPRVGMNIKYKLVDINNYNNYMINPINKVINNINYRIFISEDKQKIHSLDSLMTSDDDANIKKILDLEDTVSDEARKNKNGLYKISDTGEDIDITKAEVEYLRGNNILYYDISTKPSDAGFKELKLLNLDPNTNYYIRIVTKLDISNASDINTGVENRRSEPSSMLSATSPVVPSNPGEGELIPIAPKNMEANYLDDNLIAGEITWEIPEEIELKEDEYGFELISLENKLLPDSLGSGKMLQEIFDSSLLSNTEVEGWRLYVKDKKYLLKYYDKATKTWINATQTFKVANDKVTIIDNNNLPNKVYYYYVRTIRIKSEIPKAASAWIADSLTTSSIKRPINLIVDHNPTYSYDSKREAIIRFDAAVPTDYISTGNYGIEIFVKGDKDQDYSSTKYNNYYLEKVEGANDGYIRVYYRISGLKPGKTYSIKVRILDKTKPQETLPNGENVYPRSSFSNRVSTRTEFDQEDYDKENKYLKYIKYYEDKAKELTKTSYWNVEMDYKQVIKYRKNHNISELKYVTVGKYNLVNAKKGIQQYYLPAEMIETANDNEITIMVKFPDGDLGIRPYTLSKDKTTEIIEKIEEINNYSNSTKDYYIRLDLNVGKYNDKIEGRLPLTNLLDFDLNIVGSNISEEDFERLILQAFNNEVQKKKSYLINELEKELTNDISDSRLLKIVTDTLKLVEEAQKINIKNIIKSHMDNNYKNVANLDNSVNIGFNIDAMNDTLQGYKREGNSFKKVNSNSYANSYNIDTQEVGAYIFAPKSNIYKKLDEIYNENVTELITEYNLTDIFTGGELSDLNNNVYNYQIIAATARVLGARKGYDNEKWLEDRGIIIPVTNKYGHMTKDEAMYIFMQAYSIKNNVNLDSIKINDYNIVEDINNVNEEYRDIIIKGVNLDVITLAEGRLLPNDTVVTKTVLDMLTRINNNE
ncbi:MAG: hypothetical protein N4A63_00545 [Vallitalea sp.]|jgi:hypothetical protein|nr:hypothetical protein [Vallitalea sp.]